MRVSNRPPSLPSSPDLQLHRQAVQGREQERLRRLPPSLRQSGARRPGVLRELRLGLPEAVPDGREGGGRLHPLLLRRRQQELSLLQGCTFTVTSHTVTWRL